MTDSTLPSSLALGAHWDGRGVDFRLASRHARRVELQLFDRPDSAHPRRRVQLARRAGGLWHARLDDERPGALYGYRVDGRFAPQDGLTFHPAKLLIDPWARAVTGEPIADPSLFGHPPGRRADLDLDGRDSAAAMPKCIVVAPSADPSHRPPKPGTPWRDTVIYEVHVKGATRRHPDVPEAWRGTYRGLASEPMLDHLLELGITAVELMPVHQGAPEAHLLAQGRRNYWNYAPIAFFAPTAAYATDPLGGQVDEFRAMVDAFHRVGIEVLVDVVYNHTAEGAADGPIYGFRGIDGAAYYRRNPRWPARLVDFTGTGNTLDVRQPLVRRLIVESLRYWVEVLGVDGFRLDLAVTVGRDGPDDAFDPRGWLFETIRHDPVLADVKWIAEPWDLGPGGYQVGRFAEPWREWNDRFRDTARRVWRGEAGGPVTAELATRLAGSDDLFGHRGPLASINYVISHDGFTLRDLVSYDHRHNLENGEDNRDGTSNNLSRNWGVEGPTDDPEILRRRDLARRNLWTTLLLAQGVPMLAHGDEIGRTQRGNNNPYNQDNPTTWTDWSRPDTEFLAFARRLLALRRRFPQLRRERPLRGRRPDSAADTQNPDADIPDAAIPDADVLWLASDGRELDADAWQHPERRAFAMVLLPADADGLALLINGDEATRRFTLPPIVAVGRTTRLLDTAQPESPEETAENLTECVLAGRSQVLLAFRPMVEIRRGRDPS